MKNALDFVKNLYAGAEHDVIFTDGGLRVLWANHDDLCGLLGGGSALPLFSGDIRLPLESGTYAGKIDGLPSGAALQGRSFPERPLILLKSSRGTRFLISLVFPP